MQYTVDYNKILKELSSNFMDDNQYLEDYIKGFYKVYMYQVRAIKDVNSSYILATPGFVNLVGLNSVDSIINIKDDALPCSIAKNANEYRKQDQEILKNKTSQSFLEINEFYNGTAIYIFIKEPIINPYTKNIVGIHLSVEPMKVNSMLEIMLEMHKSNKIQLKSQKNNSLINNVISLGKKQQEVLFCISMGIIHDKAISRFISMVKNIDYTESKVKDIVYELMRKLNVSTREQLLEVIVMGKYYTYLPKGLIKYGTYMINYNSAEIKK